MNAGADRNTSFSARWSAEGSGVTVHVEGDFDRLQVAAFDDIVSAADDQIDAVTVDLRRTTLIDSAALGSLLRLRLRLGVRDCAMRTVVSAPFQRRVMRVSGLAERLGVVVGREPHDGPNGE